MPKPKLLLHSCCAACCIYVAELLKKDYVVSLFFANQQIWPREEYQKRKEETRRVANILDIEFIEYLEDKPYEEKSSEWFDLVKGLEKEKEGGKRCEVCFNNNIQKTAELASKSNFDFFTTTLTVSPHKNSSQISIIGKNAEKKWNVKFLEQDFKKNNGFLMSSNKCREHNIYRQNYCGCLFSKNM
ncbi:MAG: epoxyqueuosine reductase QueH [Nanoarchaeota archaeon]|nr:epoxyqueuosine reductase QueH [Nanoarchaeota archaeon]